MAGKEAIRVLVVDDDPRVRKATCRLLNAQGYNVAEAHTGQEGLRMAKEIKPDLIVLDVMLPDIKGTDLCRLIKTDQGLTRSLVVLASGLKVSSDNKIEGLEAGADGYIPRPIPNREFLARIEALLRLQSSGPENPARMNVKAAFEAAASTDDDMDAAMNSIVFSEGSHPESDNLGTGTSGLRVIGIGASAGGLEALEKFFENMAPDSGLAFVVVQHLSPDYKSLMAELLSKMTPMKVHRIVDGIQLEPDSIYLIPPRKNLRIMDDRLFLEEMEPDAVIHLPIDYFLRSLAENKREKAIGIILSGTGSDGMRGVRAIKEADGMVMAQDQATAKFDGMPQSAISTGLVDYILPPEEMPRELVGFVRYPGLRRTSSTTRIADEDDLSRILEEVKDHSRVDFAFYRPSTIVRRIERRMQVNHLESMEEYLKYLSGSEREKNLLYKELLIGVTKFFRDRDAYEILRKSVIVDLLGKKQEPGEELRIWVAGCSTGEEPYSIAMMCLEEMEELRKSFPIKVFATDIDRSALEFAGEGLYPESIALDVNPERLERFFVKTGESYRIERQIREMVVFAAHNLISDPPFTRMDLISCRNLLIYLQPVLQRRVLNNFAFSLNSRGFLFLGSSETVGELVDHFASIDNKWKIYKNRGGPKPHLDYPAVSSNRLTSPMLGSLGVSTLPQSPSSRHDRVLEQIYHQLVEAYSLKCLVANEQGGLLYIFGDVSNLLSFRPGATSLQVQNLVRNEISIALGTALHRCKKEGREIVYSEIPLKGKDDVRINIRVRPSSIRKDDSRLIFIFVEESGSANVLGPHEKSAESVETQTRERIGDLERELCYSRENLQATVEELETSNEELQATNEELLASNEELQSTNEELHSVNEELHTVNTEYQSKIQELVELNSDMDNLLLHTELGIVFLDENLNIRKFTQACKNYVNFRDHDLGRPISELSNILVYPDFFEDLNSVLDKKTSIQKSVRLTNGGQLWVRIVPYSRGESHLEGVVVVFVDTSYLMETEAALKNSEDFTETLMELTGAMILTIKPDPLESGLVLSASRAAGKVLGFEVNQLCAMRLNELGSQHLVKMVRDLSQGNQENLIAQDSIDLKRKDGAILNVNCRAKRIIGSNGPLVLVVFSLEREVRD